MFTDINMPGSMDGLKLAHYVRGRWPPIKLLIPLASRRPRRTIRRLGSGFIAKPYDLDKVAADFARDDRLTAYGHAVARQRPKFGPQRLSGARMPAGCRAGYYACTIMTGASYLRPISKSACRQANPCSCAELLRQDLKIEMNAVDRNKLRGSRSIWQW